jgi:hypothetical protein
VPAQVGLLLLLLLLLVKKSEATRCFAQYLTW